MPTLMGAFRCSLSAEKGGAANAKIQCRSVGNGSAYSLNAENFLGDFHEPLERSDTLLRDALTRDDAYAESTMRPTILYFAELLRDSADAAWAHAEAAQVRWQNTGLHGQHYWIKCAKLEVLLCASTDAASANDVAAPRAALICRTCGPVLSAPLT